MKHKYALRKQLMSRFINPGTDEFASICASEYVDKTGLILEINKTLGTKEKLSLVSRPRRFGKSFTAAMLCAYYEAGDDARALFSDKEVYRLAPDLPFLGAFNVICVDMAEVKARAKQLQRVLDRQREEAGLPRQQLDWILFLQDQIREDVGHAFGDGFQKETSDPDFFQMLENIVRKSGRKFFWICDEWDLFFREECEDLNAPDTYLEFLRTLFKSDGGYTARVFSGAYFTGIMPMKVMKGESAVSDFYNYTMLTPGSLAPFIGFTHTEVERLCRKHQVDFRKMIEWYDGYYFEKTGSVFNPRSVIEAIKMRQFESYWVQTTSYENLKSRIEMDLDGLHETILRLLGGEEAEINGQQFDNDLNHLTDTNKVLTALVHLGYLSYNPATRTVRIPNNEIRREFIGTLATGSHKETAKLIREADKLLQAVWKKDGEEVARLVGLAHNATGDPKTYNSESRLCLAVRLAFYTSRDHYVAIHELPGGKGYADLVFIPKKGSDKPMLIVELKWDKPVKAALAQIRDRDYPQELASFGGRILLVGITYRVRGKRHICEIEELSKQ